MTERILREIERRIDAHKGATIYEPSSSIMRELTDLGFWLKSQPPTEAGEIKNPFEPHSWGFQIWRDGFDAGKQAADAKVAALRSALFEIAQTGQAAMSEKTMRSVASKALEG